MTTIRISGTLNPDVTVIPNAFLDNYMAGANGEFLKIYLYLLRHSNQSTAITPDYMADVFCLTENDVFRALRFWEKEGLLSLGWDKNALVSIRLVPIPCHQIESGRQLDFPSVVQENAQNTSYSAVASPADSLVIKPAYPMDEIHDFMDNHNGDQLIFIIQQYIGKPLSPSEMNTVAFFYKGLGLSTDLIEYLFEYCISEGHKKFAYIETVAISWKENGIDTVDKAKEYIATFNKVNRGIMKAFGIKGRFLADEELNYIRKWTKDFRFPQEIITEACRRTIETAHAPSFKYADSILSNWSSKKVTALSDIKVLDEIHEKSRKNKQEAKKPSSNTTRFNQFKQRTYDYDEIEKKLADKLHSSVNK